MPRPVTDFTKGEELYLAGRLYGTATAWTVFYYGPADGKNKDHLVTVYRAIGTGFKYSDVDPNLLFKVRADALAAAKRMTR